MKLQKLITDAYHQRHTDQHFQRSMHQKTDIELPKYQRDRTFDV